MHAGLSLKMNHEFSLAELPLDLAAVLRDYDVDNSGSVSVAELVAGAQLMRQQAKKVRGRWRARLHFAAPPHTPRVQNKLMTKIVIALTVLLLLLLAGNFGLVWAVVVYNTPTTLSSNVLTAKASGEPVQVSSADFYYDSNGLLQLRNRASQVPMDWIGSTASCSDTSDTSTGSTGRRHLLQTGSDSISASTLSTVDAQTTQFTPTCNFSSPDFYTNRSYFLTGTCTFTKLIQMRTLVLPMVSSKTNAQVAGSIMDAAAWKAGPQTVYKGCYVNGGTPGSVMNSNVLSTSTTLANCETLAVNGVDGLSLRPYSYFGFSAASSNSTGICYACATISSACSPFQYGVGTCTGTNIQVFKLQRSPNRYQNTGPGPLANSPFPIPGGTPSFPSWNLITLTITRVDYVKNVFRDTSHTTNVCQANLIRFYVSFMTSSGFIVTQSGGNSSYIDICLTPMPKFSSGKTTWIGNYTVHSTGKSSSYTTLTGDPAYYDRPSVTGYATPGNTDFQSQLSYYCMNCPSGPYIDYSNLQYDTNLFELPCTRKGILWRFRDIYSNQGCPVWDPDNPSATDNCTWTTADSPGYGGPLGPSYCILTMAAFAPTENIFTFDNVMSFAANTGRSPTNVYKAAAAPGDTGTPPLYTYGLINTGSTPLWRDYFNSTDEAASAVSGYTWFASNVPSPSISMLSSSRRHLMQVGPSTVGVYTFTTSNGNTPYYYVGDCADKVASRNNGWRTVSGSAQSCSYAFSVTSSVCNKMNIVPDNINRVCRCITGSSNIPSSYCSASYPVCRAVASGSDLAGCFASATSAGTSSSSILAA